MVFNNGIKTYLLSFAMFGGLMGIFFSVMDKDIVWGLILGLLGGIFFALAMFLIAKIQENKAIPVRQSIASQRRLICDGPATLSGTGGWLYYTAFGFEFYPHKANLSQNNVMIPRTSIRALYSSGRKLTIETFENYRYDFVVSRSNEWVQFIQVNS